MSVNSRSTKPVMYSEIERLRALLDQLQGQIAMQAETIRRRDAQLESLRAEREDLTGRLQARARQSANHSERGARNEIMRRLAITLKTSVKWVDGLGFRQYANGIWMPVPTHTVDFVAKGINA